VSECKAKGFPGDDELLLGQIGQEYTTCLIGLARMLLVLSGACLSRSVDSVVL